MKFSASAELLMKARYNSIIGSGITPATDIDSLKALGEKVAATGDLKALEDQIAADLAEYEENGETISNIYVLTCYVTCDENNKTFYAKDGKLYFKQTNELVVDIVYEDFDIEAHNKSCIDQPIWHSMF